RRGPSFQRERSTLGARLRGDDRVCYLSAAAGAPFFCVAPVADSGSFFFFFLSSSSFPFCAFSCAALAAACCCSSFGALFDLVASAMSWAQGLSLLSPSFRRGSTASAGERRPITVAAMPV